MITAAHPKPWPHQMGALRFTYARRGSLLWLPMGAGKSRIVIDYAQNMPPGNTLILCPLKVVPVWPDEFAKYLAEPGLWTILPLDSGTVAERAALLNVPRETKNFVAVVNYDAARRDPMAKALLDISWDRIILDECHRIKAAGGKTSRYVAGLCKPCKKVIGLSGTPLSTGRKAARGKLIGGWLDMYGQARAIAPGLFGYNHQQFKQRYGIWMTQPFPKLLDDANKAEFESKLNSICFHVDEKDLAYSLPLYTDTVIPVSLPDTIRQSYDALERDFLAVIEDSTISVSNALVKQLRLQQMTGGYFLPDDAMPPPQLLHGSKLMAAMELIEDIGPEEKIVVFCKFRPEIAELEKLIWSSFKRPVYHLIGGLDTSAAWKHSSGGVLLVQISAGSEGVDLTAARYCIYYSLCHSLKDYQQSRKRVHRPGQRSVVSYYHLVCEGTIDRDIYNALSAKEEVVDGIKTRLKARHGACRLFRS